MVGDVCEIYWQQKEKINLSLEMKLQQRSTIMYVSRNQIGGRMIWAVKK
jgi:GH18 family chitinase